MLWGVSKEGERPGQSCMAIIYCKKMLRTCLAARTLPQSRVRPCLCRPRSLPAPLKVLAAEEGMLPVRVDPLNVRRLTGQHNLTVIVPPDGGPVRQTPAIREHLDGAIAGMGVSGQSSHFRCAGQHMWLPPVCSSAPSPASQQLIRGHAGRTWRQVAPCLMKMPLVQPAPCIPISTSVRDSRFMTCRCGGR